MFKTTILSFIMASRVSTKNVYLILTCRPLTMFAVSCSQKKNAFKPYEKKNVIASDQSIHIQ